MKTKSIIKRDRITREVVSKVLRRIRTERDLTQSQIVRRAEKYYVDGFGKLLESQISDFEKGRTTPSLGALLNLLAGCSPEGEVDFSIFQEALEYVLFGEDECPCDDMEEGEIALGIIEQEMRRTSQKLKSLRARVVRMDLQHEEAVLKSRN